MDREGQLLVVGKARRQARTTCVFPEASGTHILLGRRLHLQWSICSFRKMPMSPRASGNNSSWTPVGNPGLTIARTFHVDQTGHGNPQVKRCHGRDLSAKIRRRNEATSFVTAHPWLDLHCGPSQALSCTRRITEFAAIGMFAYTPLPDRPGGRRRSAGRDAGPLAPACPGESCRRWGRRSAAGTMRWASETR